MLRATVDNNVPTIALEELGDSIPRRGGYITYWIGRSGEDRLMGWGSYRYLSEVMAQRACAAFGITDGELCSYEVV